MGSVGCRGSPRVVGVGRGGWARAVHASQPTPVPPCGAWGSLRWGRYSWVALHRGSGRWALVENVGISTRQRWSANSQAQAALQLSQAKLLHGHTFSKCWWSNRDHAETVAPSLRGSLGSDSALSAGHRRGVGHDTGWCAARRSGAFSLDTEEQGTAEELLAGSAQASAGER